MTNTPRTSDDLTDDTPMPLDVADCYDDEIDWDADPALILERRELEYGINCFDQPIN